jgi:hypothetical protein
MVRQLTHFEFEADQTGWWMVVKNGQEGWAPAN